VVFTVALIRLLGKYRYSRPGPYGITTTPNGDVFYASLAGSYIGHINVTTGAVTGNKT